MALMMIHHSPGPDMMMARLSLAAKSTSVTDAVHGNNAAADKHIAVDDGVLTVISLPDWCAGGLRGRCFVHAGDRLG